MRNLNWRELNLWNHDDVRSICIQQRFYTRGDCEAYEKMLRFVDNNEPTFENLLTVTGDIYNHSDVDAIREYGGLSSEEVFQYIYNYIAGVVTHHIELAE